MSSISLHVLYFYILFFLQINTIFWKQFYYKNNIHKISVKTFKIPYQITCTYYYVYKILLKFSILAVAYEPSQLFSWLRTDEINNT